MKILVDGMNFELTRGSGIKTYTRSLINALKENSHTVDILSQQKFSKVKYTTPGEMYIAAMSQEFGSVSLRRKIKSLFDFPLNKFKGDISLTSALRAHLISLGGTSEWEVVSRIRVNPGLFFKSFARAAANFSGKSLSEYKDNDALFLSSPIPIYLKGRLNVLTVHDIIPVTHPWLVSNSSAVANVFARTLEYSLKRADKVVCVSEKTRLDLLSRFLVDERKLHVVYQPSKFLPSIGVNHENDYEILEQFGVKAKSYILFVGAIEPKKNLMALLSTVKRYKNIPDLIIIGQFAWMSEREKKMISEMTGRVRHLGFLSDYEVGAFFRNSKAFVFPSVIEGFGLPVLEALSNGIPCVVSDIDIFKELFGDNVFYAESAHAESLRDAIADAISCNDEFRKRGAVFVGEKFSQNKFSSGIENILR